MAAHPIYWVEGVRSILHAGIGSYRRHFRIVPRSDILPLFRGAAGRAEHTTGMR